MKFIYIYIFSILLIPDMYAQSVGSISGKVVDKTYQEPLEGATIRLANSQKGTLSDSIGRFSFEGVNFPETLEVSFVGMETFSIDLKESSELTIELKAYFFTNYPVVITALGIEREERALGYQVQEVDGKALTQVRTPNLLNNLSGRVAGVQITNGSSGVGSSSNIVIRGNASLSGSNQALFVVDGIPISNEIISNATENDATGFQEVDYGNGAAEISPDDIESISVLKGPSATALYGSRASNGVVVITTRAGYAYDKPKIELNASLMAGTLLTMPQYQNTYGQGSGGLFSYEDGLNGGINDGGIVSFGARLEGQPVKQFDSPSTDINGNPVRAGDVVARNGNPITPTPFVANPNNVKDFFQTALTSQNHIAISGGNEKGTYRLGLSHLNSRGIVPNSDLKRNNISLKNTYDLTDRLSVNFFGTYIRSTSENRPGTGYGSENPMYLFTWMGRQVNVDHLQDFWQAGQENIRQFNYNYAWMDNPYLTLFENTNSFAKDRLLGNLAVIYDFSQSLSLTLRTGLDNYSDLRRSQRAFSTQRFARGAFRQDRVGFREQNSDFLLRYNHTLGERWDVNFSVGGNSMDQFASYEMLLAPELSVPGIYTLENARVPLQNKQESFRKRINSLYAFSQLSFNRFIFLDLTFRNDWSSTLPLDQNAYAYYSASSSIILSDLLDLPERIDFAKVRLSGAVVGNDTDPYSLTNAFQFQSPYGSFPTVSNSATLLNNQFRPERIQALETGFDIRMFQNRLGLDMTFYRNVSQDQIVQLPTAIPSGFSSRIVNGGKILNQGIEVIFRLSPVRSRDFNWRTFANFSANRNEVLELPAGIDQYVTGFSRVYGTSDRSVWFIASPGGRLGDMYGTGLLTVDGQHVYDDNGNPVKDPDLRLLGNANPDFIIGLGNEFQFRNWQLNFLFDWRQGGTIVSRTYAIASTSGALENTLVGRENGVIGAGVKNMGTASEPNYVPNDKALTAQDYYGQFFDRDNEANALYDASYVKLRSVQLAYSLPRESAQKLGFEGLQIALIGQNLWLLTENPHFDPELNAMQGRAYVQGVEDMSYPSTRNFGVSVKLSL